MERNAGALEHAFPHEPPMLAERLEPHDAQCRQADTASVACPNDTELAAF
jgi:hypothetical protein